MEKTGRTANLTQLPRRRLATLALVAGALLCPAVFAADHAPSTIIPVTDENGRTVYVDSGKPTKGASGSRASVLVYWSNKEQRWKSVPAPSPTAMRAAHKAADEVASYVRSQPSESITPTSAMPAQSAPNATSTSRRRSFNSEILADLYGRAPASANPNYRGLASGRSLSNAEVDAAIDAAARQHKVDPNLVRAIIKVESNFNPHAVSPKGAMGLMQLMPATARQLNVNNPFDPHENVEAGVRHFKNLLNNFGGDVRLSLAAYNAGEMAVARYKGVPNFSETRNYVRQITDLYSDRRSSFEVGGAKSLSPRVTDPVRVFRGQSGVLTISNE